MIKFNEQQLKAINHKKGSAMVVAGAGSGKSTVLVHRIERLVDDGINQDDIVAITFTKNSADDLKRKLNDLGILDVKVGTFHSVLSKMLLENGINVFKTIPQFEIKKAFNEIEYNADIQDILSFISYQKSYGKNYNDTFVVKDSRYSDIEISRFFKKYEELKRDKGAYDFDDWLLEALKILKVKPNAFRCEYLLVDEHQDNNLIQNLLIKEMCPSGNIMVVGDYRQSIYGFRGAEPRYFMNFKDYFPDAKVIHLDNNYRSNSDIIIKSNNFIKKYYGEYIYYSDSIPTKTDKAEIEVEIYDTNEDQCEDVALKIKNMIELQDIEPRDIAVLYRLNTMSAEMELALSKYQIPFYVENEGNFFKSRQIAPIIAFIRLLKDESDDEAFFNLLNTRCYPFTFIPKKSVPEIEMYAVNNNCSYIQASTLAKLPENQLQTFKTFYKTLKETRRAYNSESWGVDKTIEKINLILKINDFVSSNWKGEEQERRIEGIKTLIKFAERSKSIESFIGFIDDNKRHSKKQDENAVQLQTIHRSKGLEWDNVFVIGLKDGKFPSAKSPLEEEARLFYVATTRPKKFLHISQIGGNSIFGKQYQNIE